jgi:hypothetical protein
MKDEAATELFEAYLQGEMPPREALAFGRRLRSDAEFSAAFDAYVASRSGLSELLDFASSPESDACLSARRAFAFGAARNDAASELPSYADHVAACERCRLAYAIGEVANKAGARSEVENIRSGGRPRRRLKAVVAVTIAVAALAVFAFRSAFVDAAFDGAEDFASIRFDVAAARRDRMAEFERIYAAFRREPTAEPIVPMIERLFVEADPETKRRNWETLRGAFRGEMPEELVWALAARLDDIPVRIAVYRMLPDDGERTLNIAAMNAALEREKDLPLMQYRALLVRTVDTMEGLDRTHIYSAMERAAPPTSPDHRAFMLTIRNMIWRHPSDLRFYALANDLLARSDTSDELRALLLYSLAERGYVNGDREETKRRLRLIAPFLKMDGTLLFYARNAFKYFGDKEFALELAADEESYSAEERAAILRDADSAGSVEPPERSARGTRPSRAPSSR